MRHARADRQAQAALESLKSKRPLQVLAGFAYVDRESLRVQVVSLAYAEVRDDAREHPALIAHRALLRSLVDELGAGEQDRPGGRLLESFICERGEKVYRLPRSVDLCLYVSRSADLRGEVNDTRSCGGPEK